MSNSISRNVVKTIFPIFDSPWGMHWRARIADLRGRGVYAAHANDHGCIFIHIPKTGGSSVAQILFGKESRHISWDEYYIANPVKFRRLYKFAFVRNPWDRLVSTYFFLKNGGLNYLDRDWADRNLSGYPDFASFVRGWVSDVNINSWVHFRPQWQFVARETGELMVDYVGRFEKIDESFQDVARALNIKAELPMTNKGSHRHFTDYYDDETKEIVRKVYIRDIELFDYRFDKG